MNTEFRRKLKEDLKGLVYISETDATFELVPYEETDEDKWNEFFAPLIKERKSMTADELALARRYRTIKGFMEANIKRRRIIKIGKTNIEILIHGVDLADDPIAIKTFAVET